MKWRGAACSLILCVMACLLVVAIRVRTLELLRASVPAEAVHIEQPAMTEVFRKILAKEAA